MYLYIDVLFSIQNLYFYVQNLYFYQLLTLLNYINLELSIQCILSMFHQNAKPMASKIWKKAVSFKLT